MEQSRRDDLEAAGYMMMYFLRGLMPWSGLAAKTKQEKFARIAEVKEKTPLDDLCHAPNDPAVKYPACFKDYIVSTRALAYEQRPDYNGYRRSFREAFDAAGYVEDYEYDWYKGKVPDNLAPVPIGTWSCPPQPDDAALPSTTSTGRRMSSGEDAGDACEKANEHVKRKNEEVKKIKQAFNNWDVNHDGGIDQEEFTKKLLEVGISEG